MTINEYKRALDALADEKLQEFNRHFGGGESKSREDRIREFVDDPRHERRICHLLGLQSEEEKLTEAALRSANAAYQSATSAKRSLIWTALASLVALGAMIVAVIEVFKKP